MSNTLGRIFRITSFGESHGIHVGVIIDGCPPGIELDMGKIREELQRRRPGQSELTTERNEADDLQITSGLLDHKTTGHPICILIPNKDARSADYDKLKDVYRPSHADYSYDAKYGIRDHKGGGRSSARLTAGWVAAGAVARQILSAETNINIEAYVSQIYDIALDPQKELDLGNRFSNDVRCPDNSVAEKMRNTIREAKESGDSLGGIISCRISGMPAGLGDPLFEKLSANLAKAMMTINATKGFSIGSGFKASAMKGSEHNDSFGNVDGEIRTHTNHSGGIQGGISNGMDIDFQVAFKPTATISQAQKTTDSKGNETTLEAKGRHDPCVVPRAVPIVESMACLVLLDHWLFNKTLQTNKDK